MQGSAKERFNEIQQELSQLSTKFSNNLLDATKAFKKMLKDPAEVWHVTLMSWSAQLSLCLLLCLHMCGYKVVFYQHLLVKGFMLCMQLVCDSTSSAFKDIHLAGMHESQALGTEYIPN